MEWLNNMDPTILNWVVIPLLIFCARMLDVSIGTLRVVFTSRGNKNVAPLLGFVEVLIWLVAIGQVMQNLNNVACYLAWAGGFAAGNFIGLSIEERLALGQVVIRTITAQPAVALIERLREEGYRLTVVDAQGARGPVNLLFLVVSRKKKDDVIKLITEFNPKAFYSIEDVRFVSEYDSLDTGRKPSFFSRMLPNRK
jgi:uncharacterized protein YebE (UPF0316 family)